MQEIGTKADTYCDFEEDDMRAEAETTFELGGERYRRTASGYCTRGGRRIPREEFDWARGEHLEQLGRRLSAVGREAGSTIAARRARELAGEAESKRETMKKEETVRKETGTKRAARRRRPRDVAFECEVGGRAVTLTSRQCEFLQAASSCPCWAEGGAGIWTDILLDECGMNGMSFGAMVSTLREKGLLEVGREEREDGATGRGRRVKVIRLTRLGEAVLKRAGYRLPGA